MAEIVNLRQARKRKAKAGREEQAAENRAKFGKSKADKRTESATKKRDEKLLDGHKRSD